jgi:hypothetical protein
MGLNPASLEHTILDKDLHSHNKVPPLLAVQGQMGDAHTSEF